MLTARVRMGKAIISHLANGLAKAALPVPQKGIDRGRARGISRRLQSVQCLSSRHEGL